MEEVKNTCEIGLQTDVDDNIDWSILFNNPSQSDIQRFIGEIYEKGVYNPAKSKEWYQKSAQQGNPQAQYLLSKKIEDKEESKKWLLQSATNGYAEAQYQYHFVCVLEEKIKWLTLASEQGHIDAIYQLACVHYCNFESIPRYTNETHGKNAFKWFMEYIEKTKPEERNAFAHDAIGAMHFRVPYFLDYEKSLYHLNMCIELLKEKKRPYKRMLNLYEYMDEEYIHCSVNGIYHEIGNLYFYGRGTKQDYQKAHDNYILAVKENNSDKALYQLYIIYRDGLGQEVDEDKAKKYLFESASRGYVEAKYQVALSVINTPLVQDYWHGLLSDDHVINEEDDVLDINVEENDEAKKVVTMREKVNEVVGTAVTLLEINTKHVDSLVLLGIINWFSGSYDKCLQLWQDAKKLEDRADINYYLYRLYAEKIKTSTSHVTAIDYAIIYQEKADDNTKLFLSHIKANRNVLKIYDIPDSPDEMTFNCCQNLVKYGNPRAQFILSWLYWYGYGTKQNKMLAVEWFCQALLNDKVDDLEKLRSKYANYEIALIMEARKIKEEEEIERLRDKLKDANDKIAELQYKIKELVDSVSKMT